jgi:hypothetical protein
VAHCGINAFVKTGDCLTGHSLPEICEQQISLFIVIFDDQKTFSYGFETGHRTIE